MASATTSISVSCPSCAKVLRLSARPAKGKKIKCPACGSAFVPEFDDDTAIQEKPGTKAKASSSKTSPKRSHDDPDEDAGPPKRRRRYDDEEEEDDAPPRKRKKAKKQAAGSMMLTVLLVVGGAVAILSCGVVGLTAFVWPGFMITKPDKVARKNQGLPKELDKDKAINPPVVVQGMDPLTFNNSVAQVNQRIAGAVDPFARAIGPAVAGQKVNMAEVHRSYKAMQDTLVAVQAETQAWKIPAGGSARNFYDSHQRFLKVQEEGINDFAKIVSALENPALSPLQKSQQAKTIAFQVSQKERPVLADLQATQRVFAAENNIIIMPGR